MQEMSVATLEDVEYLKKRVQHLEEELAKIKMKMACKKWL
jgi:polyhydroxyalkanoate synthesis regulator phasin